MEIRRYAGTRGQRRGTVIIMTKKKTQMATLKELARDSKKSVADLKKQLKSILEMDELEIFEGDQKKSRAFSILRGRIYRPHVNKSNIPVKDFLFICMASKSAREINSTVSDSGKSMVANAYGFAKEIDENGKPGKTIYATISGFEGAAEIVASLESDKVYKMTAGAKTTDQGFLDLRAVEGVTEPEVTTKKCPNFLNVILKAFKETEIVDLEFYPSKDRNDLKMIHGQVVLSSTFNRKDGGGKGGVINLIDDSLSGEFIRQNKGLTIFTEPENIIYGDGSFLYVIGSTRKQETDGKVELTMYDHVIVPELALPKKDTPKSVRQTLPGELETIAADIDDDEDEDDLDDLDDLDDDEEEEEVKTPPKKKAKKEKPAKKETKAKKGGKKGSRKKKKEPEIDPDELPDDDEDEDTDEEDGWEL